jgi:hypothetical protein
MEQLRENRAKGATGHDDGPFRAERAACSDRDGGRDRFEQRHLRLNQTAAEENRFERFGNSVAANFFRTVSRHQPDHERTGDRRENDPGAEMMMLKRTTPATIAGKKPDW